MTINVDRSLIVKNKSERFRLIVAIHKLVYYPYVLNSMLY